MDCGFHWERRPNGQRKIERGRERRCLLRFYSSFFPPSPLFDPAFLPFFSPLWFLSLLSLFSSTHTLPPPHPDCTLLQCSLSLSLCSKVKLMNDRACHQFHFFPLHLSHTHTHSVMIRAAAALCSQSTGIWILFCRLLFCRQLCVFISKISKQLMLFFIFYFVCIQTVSN